MTAATAAIVVDGIVEQLALVNVDADRHTDFTWPFSDGASIVVLPDGSQATHGWTYDGSTFAAPD